MIAVAGSPGKVAACRDLGADVVIDYRRDDLVDAVRSATGGAGADIVVDPVGGDLHDRVRRVVAFEGRLVVIGFAGGGIPRVSAGYVMVKNYAVVGLHLGLYRRRAPEVVHGTHAELMRLVENKVIAPRTRRGRESGPSPSSVGDGHPASVPDVGVRGRSRANKRVRNLAGHAPEDGSWIHAEAVERR